MQTLCAHSEENTHHHSGDHVVSPAVSNPTWRRHPFLVLACMLMTLCCMFVGSLNIAPQASALTVPGIDRQDDAGSSLSPCEQALKSGLRNQRQMEYAMPSSYRLLSAESARHQWNEVAVQCSERFAEGTVRSALATYRAQRLAAQLKIKLSDAPSPVLTESLQWDMDANEASALSVAEDREAFALEVLAARKNADQRLYRLSDQRKLNAQLLADAVEQEDDARQRVYSVAALLGNKSDTTVDPSNGVQAPTVAVLEMNCALEQLQALADTEEAKSSDGDEQSAREQTLVEASELIAAHMYQAFTDGYPAVESLLLR